MPEFLKNITDSAKFLAMLVIYTAYMTWWASGVSHDIETMSKLINDHILAGDHHPFYQTQAINGLVKVQEQQTVLIAELIHDHAKCKLLMEIIQEQLQDNRDIRKWEEN